MFHSHSAVPPRLNARAVPVLREEEAEDQVNFAETKKVLIGVPIVGMA